MSDDNKRSDALRTVVERRDLTDPAQGEHPMQVLVDRLDADAGDLPRHMLRTPPLVPGREGWRVRHSTTETVHAALPDLLRDGAERAVVRCPGLVCGGRQGASTALVAHQLDYWLLGETASTALADLVQRAMKRALSQVPYRLLPAGEPAPGRELRIDILDQGAWQEVGGCGVLRHEGRPAAVGFRLMLEPLLAASDLACADDDAGVAHTVTSSRS